MRVCAKCTIWESEATMPHSYNAQGQALYFVIGHSPYIRSPTRATLRASSLVAWLGLRVHGEFVYKMLISCGAVGG